MGDVISSFPRISGVEIIPLKQIPDDRGMVMHMMRNDSPYYDRFGEIYFSLVYQGAVKAWKMHLRMKQFLAVPVGQIKLVCFDDRDGSSSRGVVQEILSGESNYGLVIIPPNVWYGFQGMAAGSSLVVNCATMPHDPSESIRIDHNSRQLPFQWGGV